MLSLKDHAKMLYKKGDIYFIDIFFRILVNKEEREGPRTEVNDIKAFAAWLKEKNVTFPNYIIPFAPLLEYLERFPMNMFFLRKIHLATNELKCIHVLYCENGCNKVCTYKTFEEARDAHSLNGDFDPEIIRFVKNEDGEVEYE